MATIDKIQEADLDASFYIRIEGVGYISGTPESSQAVYPFTRATDWTPTASQRFVTGLKVPSSFTESADLWGGIGDAGGASFELDDFLDTDGTRFWSRLFASERWQARPSSLPVTYLAATLDRDDTTATVESTAGFAAGGGVLCIGNETTTYTGLAAGPPRFTGLTRGLHPIAGSNFALHHRFDADGIRPLVTTRPYTWYGRMVSCYVVHQIPTGRGAFAGPWETESNARRLWTGRIRRLDWHGDRNAYVLACDGMLGDLERRVFSRPRAETKLTGLNLGSRSDDRRIWVSGTGAGPGYTAALSQFYVDATALKEAAQTAIDNLWGSASLNRPLITLAGEVDSTVPGMPSAVLAANTFAIARRPGGLGFTAVIPPGIAQAMGWPPEFLNIDGAATIAPTPAPVVSWWDFGGLSATNSATLFVEDTAGFQVDQGEGDALVLIGGRFLFHIQSATTIGGIPAFQGRTVLNPEFSAYGGNRAIAQGSDEAIIESNSTAQATNASVVQVFAPPPRLTVEDQNVLDHMLRVMTSTGTPGYNGLEDVYTEGIGLGIRDDEIDVAGWRALALDLGAELGAGRGRIFIDPLPMTDWIKEEGRVMGFCVVVSGGLITVRRAPGMGTSASATLTLTGSDLDGLDERPAFNEGPALLMNQVSLRYRWLPFEGDPGRDGDGFTSVKTVLADVNSIDAFGLRTMDMQSRGLVNAGIANLIKVAAAARLALWGRFQPVVRFKLQRRHWSRIAPLDVVSFTNPSLPNRQSGSLGVTDQIMVVKSVTTDLHGGLSVEAVLFGTQRQAPLAPSTLLDYSRGDGGFDAVNRRLYCRSHEFSAASASVDVAHFLANFRIVVIEDATTTPAAPQLWRVTVTAAGPDVTNLFIPIVEDLPGFVSTRRYFVTFDHFSVALVAQQTEASWIASSVDSIIAGIAGEWYPYI